MSQQRRRCCCGDNKRGVKTIVGLVRHTGFQDERLQYRYTDCSVTYAGYDRHRRWKTRRTICENYQAVLVDGVYVAGDLDTTQTIVQHYRLPCTMTEEIITDSDVTVGDNPFNILAWGRWYEDTTADTIEGGIRFTSSWISYTEAFIGRVIVELTDEYTMADVWADSAALIPDDLLDTANWDAMAPLPEDWPSETAVVFKWLTMFLGSEVDAETGEYVVESSDAEPGSFSGWGTTSDVTGVLPMPTNYPYTVTNEALVSPAGMSFWWHGEAIPVPDWTCCYCDYTGLRLVQSWKSRWSKCPAVNYQHRTTAGAGTEGECFAEANPNHDWLLTSPIEITAPDISANYAPRSLTVVRNMSGSLLVAGSDAAEWDDIYGLNVTGIVSPCDV